MNIRIVEEAEFSATVTERLAGLTGYDFVTGPGRSGAIAAVYASHFLGIPFIPYKASCPGRPLIVDTACLTGRTIRKASKVYGGADFIAFYQQPERVKFWYERLSLVRGRGNEYRRVAA